MCIPLPRVSDFAVPRALAPNTVNAAAMDFEAALEDLGRFRAKWPGRVERLITAVVLDKQGSAIQDVIVFTPR